MENKKRVIVVLGVYRSGTSTITKGLQVLGVRLPDPKTVTFNKFNEKGYWEDQDFILFNLELLKALSSLEQRHRDILTLTSREVVFLEEQGFLEKASQLLLEKVSDLQPLALKTSSFSILLPFWKKVFEACDIQASFVIALRNPLSIVASVEQAQEMLGKQDQEKSFWVWISYMLSCLEHTAGYERLFVSYDNLLKAPACEIQRMADVFELKINDQVLKSYCDDFIDCSLRHFNGEENQLFKNSFCQTFSVEIYEKLFRVAKGEMKFSDLKNFLKKWKKQFLLAESLLILVEKVEYDAKKIQEMLGEREIIISNLHGKVNQHIYSLAECYKTIHQQNLQIASLLEKNVPVQAMPST